MWLNLGIRSVRISESIPLSQDSVFSQARLSVCFDVEPQGIKEIILATGEVFRNRFWANAKDLNIKCQLLILPTDTEHHANEMTYFGGPQSSGGSGISMYAHLPEHKVRELYSDAKTNVFPETIRVKFADQFLSTSRGEPGLSYGLAGDGSEWKWNNVKDGDKLPTVTILGFEFQYAAYGADSLENRRDLIRPPSLFESSRITSEKVSALAEMINKATKTLGWGLRAGFAVGLWGLVLLPSVVWAKDLPEQVVMIRKSSGVELETTIYRPEGPGPFPLVVINHGKAPNITPGRQPRARFANASREFLSRGFVVAIPMRQGFSKSTGAYRGEGCEIEVNGRTQADDIEGALDYLVKQSYVDATKIVVMGQSHGGLTTMAFGMRAYPGVRALVNFAGGLKNLSCTWQQNNIAAYRSYGKNAQYPSLWFYGDNDSYWPPYLYRDYFDAFVKGGGKAELIAYGTFGHDSHVMFDASRGMGIWVPKVMTFLDGLGFDTKNKVDYRIAASRQLLPEPTDFADLADVDAVPNVRDAGRAGYLKFLEGASPRAFAISTAGSNYAWVSGREFAADTALENCNKNAKGNLCKLYAVNDEVVW